MRINTLIITLSVCTGTFAQTTHELHMTGEAFMPDTLYMLPGDSVHLVFDTLGHSMVQVPEESWEQEIPTPLIGFSMGFGTPNPGDFHTFVMDSTGTFHYLCEQHPSEKGVLMVGEEFTAIGEYNTLPDVRVHPQPASDRLFITTTLDHAIVRLSDDQGRPLRNYKATRNGGFDVSDVPPGMYIITLLSSDGAPVSRGKALISR